MTIDEKLAISNKAFTLLESGDKEGISRLLRTAPCRRIWQKFPKRK
jgi:hypothetical protein